MRRIFAEIMYYVLLGALWLVAAGIAWLSAFLTGEFFVAKGWNTEYSGAVGMLGLAGVVGLVVYVLVPLSGVLWGMWKGRHDERIRRIVQEEVRRELSRRSTGRR